MSELDGYDRELQIHDPFVIPDDLELEHEIKRPKWWYAQQLRLAGASWDDIAAALGYSSAQTASSTVRTMLDREVVRQSAQELLTLELERLDMLQLVVWRRARQGDLKAIDAVLRIMAQRAKYMGLDNKQYEDERTDKSTIVIGGDSEDYIAAIKHAQELHRKPIEGSTP